MGATKRRIFPNISQISSGEVLTTPHATPRSLTTRDAGNELFFLRKLRQGVIAAEYYEHPDVLEYGDDGDDDGGGNDDDGQTHLSLVDEVLALG